MLLVKYNPSHRILAIFFIVFHSNIIVNVVINSIFIFNINCIFIFLEGHKLISDSKYCYVLPS